MMIAIARCDPIENIMRLPYEARSAFRLEGAFL